LYGEGFLQKIHFFRDGRVFCGFWIKTAVIINKKVDIFTVFLIFEHSSPNNHKVFKGIYNRSFLYQLNFGW